MNYANVKIVIAGDESVGKTCLIRRLVKNEFPQDYQPTLGFEISLHKLQIENIAINCIIWDIGGQTAFDSVRRGYYSESRGFLLVFSLDNITSFRNLNYWAAEIKESCPEAPIVLVGNKVDLPDQKIPHTAIEKKAKDLGVAHSLLTSAMTGQGVTEAFTFLGTEILHTQK